MGQSSGPVGLFHRGKPTLTEGGQNAASGLCEATVSPTAANARAEFWGTGWTRACSAVAGALSRMKSHPTSKQQPKDQMGNQQQQQQRQGRKQRQGTALKFSRSSADCNVNINLSNSSSCQSSQLDTIATGTTTASSSRSDTSSNSSSSSSNSSLESLQAPPAASVPSSSAEASTLDRLLPVCTPLWTRSSLFTPAEPPPASAPISCPQANGGTPAPSPQAAAAAAARASFDTQRGRRSMDRTPSFRTSFDTRGAPTRGALGGSSSGQACSQYMEYLRSGANSSCDAAPEAQPPQWQLRMRKSCDGRPSLNLGSNPSMSAAQAAGGAAAATNAFAAAAAGSGAHVGPILGYGPIDGSGASCSLPPGLPRGPGASAASNVHEAFESCTAVVEEMKEADGVVLGALLGAGSFGKVYLGTMEGQQVAVKVIETQGEIMTSKILNELELMMKLKHTNIVQALHVAMWQRPHGISSTMSSSGANLMVMPGPAMGSSFGGFGGSSGSSSGQQLVPAIQLSCSSSSSHSGPLYSVCSNLGAGDSCGALCCGGSLGGYPELMPEEEAADDECYAWIVLEYCEGGTFADAIKQGLYYNEEGDTEMGCLLPHLLDIAQGLAYLHEEHILHDDIKPSNILLNRGPVPPPRCSAEQRDSLEEGGPREPRMVCKLSDFGLSRLMSPELTHCQTKNVGTLTHMAPEVLSDGRLSPAADVYSFGILMWEAAEAAAPFEGCYCDGQIIEQVLGGHRPKFTKELIPGYAELAEACWAADPAARPKFKTVVKRLKILMSVHQQQQRLRRQQSRRAVALQLLSSALRVPQTVLQLSPTQSHSEDSHSEASSVEGELAAQQQEQQQRGPTRTAASAAAGALLGPGRRQNVLQGLVLLAGLGKEEGKPPVAPSWQNEVNISRTSTILLDPIPEGLPAAAAGACERPQAECSQLVELQRLVKEAREAGGFGHHAARSSSYQQQQLRVQSGLVPGTLQPSQQQQEQQGGCVGSNRSSTSSDGNPEGVSGFW